MTEELASPSVQGQPDAENWVRDLCCNVQVSKYFFSEKHVFGSN